MEGAFNNVKTATIEKALDVGPSITNWVIKMLEIRIITSDMEGTTREEQPGANNDESYLHFCGLSQ